MSTTPIFHATLLDYPELWGGSALLARPVLPLYTSKNWVHPKPWAPVQTTVIPNEYTPRWKTFLRCLLWWLP